MSRPEVTVAALIASARRMAKKLREFVADVEWWNRHRADAPPFDCELERINLQLAERMIAALESGDTVRAGEITSEIMDNAKKAITDGGGAE